MIAELRGGPCGGQVIQLPYETDVIVIPYHEPGDYNVYRSATYQYSGWSTLCGKRVFALQ